MEFIQKRENMVYVVVAIVALGWYLWTYQRPLIFPYVAIVVKNWLYIVVGLAVVVFFFQKQSLNLLFEMHSQANFDSDIA